VALEEVRRYFGAKVMIGEKDATMLIDPSANLSASLGEELTAKPADKLLHDGDIIQVGQFQFTVLETPGHSPGSISLYGHDVVFTGDAYS